jgi:hypothetical protein
LMFLIVVLAFDARDLKDLVLEFMDVPVPLCLVIVYRGRGKLALKSVPVFPFKYV